MRRVREGSPTWIRFMAMIKAEEKRELKKREVEDMAKKRKVASYEDI